jgi:NAD(P)H dehydrogenase (quinone)
MSIVITGATGHLGRITIKALLDRGVPATDIVAAGRNAVALTELAGLGVRTASIDYSDPDSLAAAFVGADKVLLISGTTPGERVAQHGAVIDAAKAAGVGQIVYTSAPRADTTTLVLAPDHAATEALLRQSAVPFTVLRNNWYTENYLDTAKQAAATGEIVGSAGDGRVASASRADFAEAAAVVLTTDGHLGRTYELNGDVSWTFADLAAVLGELAGRPVSYRSVTTEQHIEILHGFGLDDGTAGFVAALDNNIREGTLDSSSTDLRDLIGRPTTPLAEGLAGAFVTAG